MFSPVFALASHDAPQGFGTCGNQAAYSVTNLEDSGAGSLRDAMSQGRRLITFAVTGEILPAAALHVLGPCMTIDATGLPLPGITIRGHGIICAGDEGCRDLIVRNVRVRDAATDAFQIRSGGNHVYLEHVTASGSLDGNIDVTDNMSDVTVQDSIIGPSLPIHSANSLNKYSNARITYHHNLFINADARNPFFSMGDLGEPAIGTTGDVRNNVVAGCVTGTFVNSNARVNVVNNLYSCPSQTNPMKLVIVDTLTGGRAYVSGNMAVQFPGADINSVSTEAAPFDAASVTAQVTCDAALSVEKKVGVLPRDTTDQSLVDSVDFGSCRPQQPQTVTLTLSLSAGGDDASQAANGSMTTTETETVLGSTDREAGYRFVAVGLPAGKQIVSARLTFVCRSMCGNGVQWTYAGEKSLVPATFGSTLNNISLRPHTAASLVDTPAGWTAGSRVASPELRDILQEIVNQPGWTSDSPVVVFIKGGGSSTRRLATFETSTAPTGSAQLVVTYQP